MEVSSRIEMRSLSVSLSLSLLDRTKEEPKELFSTLGVVLHAESCQHLASLGEIISC